MVFIMPQTTRKHDSIMVTVDKLSESSHFVPVKSTHKTSEIARIFMRDIFKVHGLPKEIMSDMDV